jgi:hypothetical protein
MALAFAHEREGPSPIPTVHRQRPGNASSQAVVVFTVNSPPQQHLRRSRLPPPPACSQLICERKAMKCALDEHLIHSMLLDFAVD